MSFARSVLAAGSVVVAAGLLAGPASAARKPHIPPPPAPPSARSAPPGVHAHVRVLRLDRTTRRHGRHHGARAASLPPVNPAALQTWPTGSAFCDSLNLDSYWRTHTDLVYPPTRDQAPSAPGRAFLRIYWQAGLALWDPNRNVWRSNPPVSSLVISNPMDDFAFWYGPDVPSGGLRVAPGTNAWGYTWLKMWWHYTATADESWSGTGGIWYSAVGYLHQNSYGGTANGACFWS